MRRPPAALQTRWLLTLGATVAMLVTVAATVASVGVTTATFTDRVTTSAELEADTLPAPVAVTATLASNLQSATVNWGSPPGDFADSWDVVRRTGACSGWTPPTGGTVTSDATSPHVDGSLTAPASGATYCYAVRGTLKGWSSPYSATGPATEVRVPAVTRLYPSGAASLQTSAGTTGTYPFGCTVLGALGLVCLSTETGPYVLTSPQAYTEIPTNQGWQASVRLRSSLAVSLGPVTLNVHAWYESGACTSPPTNGRLIASGSHTFTVPLLGMDQVVPITLAPNPGFEAPTSPQRICLQYQHTGPSLLGLLLRYDVVNGANTWIQGRFE